MKHAASSRYIKRFIAFLIVLPLLSPYRWDNWFEGELGCSPALLEQIEMLVHSTFKIAEPENLKPEVIALNRQWKEENQRKRN